MGCFSIPKNKSKVAAAAQQVEQHQSTYYGSKLEQLLSSNKPVLLPDPNDLSGGQSQVSGSIPAPASIRGGKQHRNQSPGRERGGCTVISTTGANISNSSRLINQHPRALSAPVNYPSAPPSDDQQRLQAAHSDNSPAIPFSAPLDGISPPVSPPTVASHGSPLHGLIAAVGMSEVINRGSQLGLDKRVTKAFIDRKTGLFTGRPVRLPIPQVTIAHPLPLPHPPESDDAGVVLTVGLAVGSSSSVSPSPNRGKDGQSTYCLWSLGGGNPVEALPLPPPALPTDSRTPVRAFPYSDLAHALVPECFLGEGVFGRAYKAWVDYRGDNSNEKKIEVAVVCPVVNALQGLREWMAEVNWLARLQDPHLCKLIGYCAEDIPGLVSKRLLVYEYMNNGSLDKFIKGNESGRHLDWSTRTRVALHIARCLAYLHDKAPFQVICRDLSSPSIQLDKDLRAKLSGFGLARCGPEGDQGLLMAGPYVAPESGRNGLVTIKSNAWSFGVVLLELLTGRRHMDPSFPSGQQNLVQLTKPFLRDEGKLFLIMDPELNGRYSSRGALKVANLAFQCLIKEASLRPNLSEAVEVLRTVQTDEESLAGDLKKSRSLTQSGGSPVTYCRSTSDHFVQRTLNSLTASPSSDPKQRDREFVKSAAFGSGMLGSVVSSPSYIDSRLSADLKQLKGIVSDRDTQKSPIPGQHHFESRQQPMDTNQQRERDPLKCANTHFIETPSTVFTDAKQHGLRKVSSYGTVNSASSSIDCKRPSNSVQVQGRGEVKRLQPPYLTGMLFNTEIRQKSGELKKLAMQPQSQEVFQSSETRWQGRERKAFQMPQTSVSIEFSEIQQQSPLPRMLPSPESSSAVLLNSGELKQESLEGWKSLVRQSSLSSLPRSGELKQRNAGPCSGEQRNSEARKRSAPLSPVLPSSGELKQLTLEAGMSAGSFPHSDDIRQRHQVLRKVPTGPHFNETSEQAKDMGKQDKVVPKLSILLNSERHRQVCEQEIQVSSSAQSTSSTRLSCAPSLTFEPPLGREEFCVW